MKTSDWSRRFDFERAVIPQSEIDREMAAMFAAWVNGDKALRALVPAADESAARALIIDYMNRVKNEIIFKSTVYQVNIRKTPKIRNEEGQEFWPEMIHLSIKRIDRAPFHDWRELQGIKNGVLGPEFEAVELYPAESRCVDTANQYHLWALIDEGAQFPFGFTTRAVGNAEVPGSKAKQREFSTDGRPAGPDVEQQTNNSGNKER